MFVCNGVIAIVDLHIVPAVITFMIGIVMLTEGQKKWLQARWYYLLEKEMKSPGIASLPDYQRRQAALQALRKKGRI